MASFSEIAKRKIAGVPVLYLAGAFVVILAIVAWRMKTTASPDEPTGDENTTSENVPTDGDPNVDYSGLATQGTVTVVQGGEKTEEESKKATNEEWERSAVDYLVDAKLATPTEAQSAIHKYLQGSDLTYDEGKLKDAAILKLKLPPEPLTTIGNVGSSPAQKQFSNYPGKHTVKGSNDNTPSKLAALYYGSASAVYVDEIVAANPTLGPAGTTYRSGTTLVIPRWTGIKYYTTTKKTLWPSQVAAKNGISYAQVLALNPGKAVPYKLGEKIRID
jgi:phage tail protein X